MEEILTKGEQLFKTILAGCAAFGAVWALFAHKDIADYFKSGQMARESIVMLCDSSNVKKDLALYTLYHTLRHDPENNPLIKDIARTMFRNNRVRNEESEAAQNILIQLNDTAWLDSLKIEKAKKPRNGNPSDVVNSTDSVQVTMASYAKFNAAAVVYVQYASTADEDKINNIRKDLNSQNYLAPPAELIPTYTGANEIRYFNDSDKVQAENLALLLKSAQIKGITLVKAQSKVPVPLGQLEVWIKQM